MSAIEENHANLVCYQSLNKILIAFSLCCKDSRAIELHLHLMKFFFPELGSCFSGTPAVETIAAEVPRRRQRRMTQGNSTKHWRPALTAIAEDGGVPREVRRQSGQSTAGFRSEKKPLIKSKLAGKTLSDLYGSDYRKVDHPMAIPAFSPTPFLF